MRTLNVVAVVIVVLVASVAFADSTPGTVVNEEILTTAPSKVCHPKKPITCRANDLQIDVAALLAPQSAPAQEAALCFGPRWLCRVDMLESQETIQELTKPAVESEEAALCFGPRWLCRTETLN